MVTQSRVGKANRLTSRGSAMTAMPAEHLSVAPTIAGLGIVEPASARPGALAPPYDGSDFLRAIQDGELPPPPVAELLGFEIVEVAKGEVTFAMTPAEKHYNPIGSVHGGVVATLLDTVMGCALHTLLPRGAWYTT